MPYPKTLMLSPKTILLPNPCPQDVIFLCLLGNPGCYYAPCLPQTARSEFGHPQPLCSQWFAPIHVQMCPNEQIAHLQKRNLLYVAIDPTLYAYYASGEAYPVNDYPFPPKVDDVPDYTGTVDSNERAAIKTTHAMAYKRQNDVINMNTALIDAFLDLIPVAFK